MVEQNPLLSFRYDVEGKELYPEGSGPLFAGVFFGRRAMRPGNITMPLGNELPVDLEDTVNYVDAELVAAEHPGSRFRPMAAAIIIMRLKVDMQRVTRLNADINPGSTKPVDLGTDLVSLEPVEALIIADDDTGSQSMLIDGSSDRYIWNACYQSRTFSGRLGVHEEMAVHLPLGRIRSPHTQRAEVFTSTRNGEAEPVLVISRGIERVLQASQIKTMGSAVVEMEEADKE